jgi:hypothetical protein
MGGNGTFIQLFGTEGRWGCYVVEVPGAGALNPERHMYEEIMVVVEGRGTTEIWTDDQKKRWLPAVAKAGIVVGGYAAAILLALCVVSIYIYQTSGPDRDASAGMYAFGDSLLFIAVFGVASTVPTALALVFLRQSRYFWIAVSVVALALASTSLAAVAAILLEQQKLALTASFGLAALFAPEARFRWCLFGAASAEGLSSVYGFSHWFAPLFFH